METRKVVESGQSISIGVKSAVSQGSGNPDLIGKLLLSIEIFCFERILFIFGVFCTNNEIQ